MKRHVLVLVIILVCTLAAVQETLADNSHLVFPGWTQTSYSTRGHGPFVIADINVDGVPDVVMFTLNSPGIKIFDGTSDGLLSEFREYSLGSRRLGNSIASGDLVPDSQHLPDIVVSGYFGSIGSNTPVLIVLRNQGTPDYGFAVHEEYVLPFAVGVIDSVGDFNGDGILDIVCKGNYGLYLLHGQGDGTYAQMASSSFGIISLEPSLISADFDKDGRSDIVTINRSNLVILHGAQDPSVGFERRIEYAAPMPGSSGDTQVIAVADFNGDSLLDIVHRTNSDKLYLYHALAEGGFQEPIHLRVPYSGQRKVPGKLVSGDIDGDGRPDIITMPYHDESRQPGKVLFNIGFEGFSSPKEFFGGSPPRCVAVADLDRDGRDEIISSFDSNPPRICIIRAIPRGPDAAAAPLVTGKGQFIPDVPYFLEAIDIDEDSVPELAIADLSQNRIVLRKYMSNGGFSTEFDEVPLSNIRGEMISGHFDSDEFPDLVVALTTGYLAVLHGMQDGTFVDPPQDIPVRGSQRYMQIADFNDDRIDDLIFVNGYLNILTAQADRTLHQDNLLQYPLPAGTSGIAVGFLDGDSSLDIAVSHNPNSSGYTVSIYYGNGDGSVSVPEPEDGYNTTQASHIAVGDMNGDGLTDIITTYLVSSYDSRTNVSFLMGHPAGGFEEPVSVEIYGQCSTRELEVRDFDFDGLGDVLLGTSHAHYILFGRKANIPVPESFASLSIRHPVYVPSQPSTITGPSTVIADFNRDGRPDIVCAGVVTGTTRMLFTMLNQSTGRMPGDLAVTAITDSPSTGVTGDVVTIRWTVQNQGDKELTASWSDAVYLSRDDEWDINDKKIKAAEKELRTLAPKGQAGDSYNASLQIAFPSAAPSDYFILVRTDITDQVGPEDDDEDNTMASAIAMDLPTLPVRPAEANPEDYPGIDESFAEEVRVFCYRIDTEANKDLVIKLDAESLGGMNELYIRYGAVPSRSNYDFKYGDTYFGDTAIRVPGTKAGVYYVMAYADKLPEGGGGQFNINAMYMPLNLSTLSPDHGGNTGRVTVTFKGSGFHPNIQVAIQPYGAGEILPDDIFFHNAGSFAATFDLDGKQETGCGLRITNPDGEEVLLEEAFNIERGQKYDLEVSMTGARSIRPGQPSKFKLFLKNRSNVDIPFVFLYLSVPDVRGVEGRTMNIVIEPRDQLSDPPQIVSMDWTKYDPTFAYGGRLYYPLVLMGLPPSQRDLEFTVRTTTEVSGFTVLGHVSIASYEEYETLLYEALWELIESRKEGTASLKGVMYLQGGTTIEEDIENYYKDRETFKENFSDTIDVAKRLTKWYYWGPAKIIAAATAGKHPIKAIIDATKDLNEIFRDAEKIVKNTRWWAQVDVDITRSRDPNKKLSPNGFGALGFVSAHEVIPYTVLFENLPNATAAALIVDVTDNLDENLDWSSLQLEEIGFGESVIRVPDENSHYNGQVAIDGWDWNIENGWFRYEDGDPNKPVMLLVVDVNADIDTDTGAVQWKLVCSDVNTGYFPEGAAGFLPPNMRELFYPDPNDPFAVHPGEGYVKYSVMPDPNLPTGTIIRNKARIVFDWNAPIDTPEVVNTIDADAPTSSVSELPVVSTGRNFVVEWVGDDVGSGVGYCDIYVADDGGEYELWLGQTVETSALYHGENGHIYSFYSVAVDNVGLREDAPGEADAETLIDRPVGDLSGDNAVGLDDLALFVEQWARTDCDEVVNNYCEEADFNKDGKTDMEDLTVMADNWLEEGSD